MLGDRLLSVRAGSFRLALPLAMVRQVLTLGGADGSVDPNTIGVRVVSLAKLLGDAPSPTGKAPLLMIDDAHGPLVVAGCELVGVRVVQSVSMLPTALWSQWPGLVTAIVGLTPIDAPAVPEYHLLLASGFLGALAEAAGDQVLA
jgi:hypothetical protein